MAVATILSPYTRAYKIGRGQCLFAPWNSSYVAASGYFHLGNVKSFNYTNKPTIDKMFSSMGGPSNLSDIGVSQLDGEVSIKITEFSRLNVSIAMGGTELTATQSVVSSVVSGTGIGAITSSLTLGSYYYLGARNVTVTDLKTASTSLVAGANGVGDYTIVDPLAGIIQINQTPVTGAVVAGAPLGWDGSAAAITGLDQVSLADNAVRGGSFIFLPNNARGVNQEVHLFAILFTPDQGPDWVADKYGEYTIKGSVLNDWQGPYGGVNHGSTNTLQTGYIVNQTTT